MLLVSKDSTCMPKLGMKWVFFFWWYFDTLHIQLCLTCSHNCNHAASTESPESTREK